MINHATGSIEFRADLMGGDDFEWLILQSTHIIDINSVILKSFSNSRLDSS